MNERTKTSIIAVLTAAIHNAKMALDQVQSLVNDEDKSFQNYPIKTKQLEDGIKVLEEQLEEVSAKETKE
jgi:hypothetical protein